MESWILFLNQANFFIHPLNFFHFQTFHAFFDIPIFFMRSVYSFLLRKKQIAYIFYCLVFGLYHLFAAPLYIWSDQSQLLVISYIQAKRWNNNPRYNQAKARIFYIFLSARYWVHPSSIISISVASRACCFFLGSQWIHFCNKNWGKWYQLGLR